MDIRELIKQSIEQVPESCKGDPGVHEWEHTYGRFVYYKGRVGIAHVPMSEPTRMYPYYLCKHCHAVSETFTTNYYPKRAR